jgi:uncharacterized protein involved in exopolysaccharide biosynthesis
VPSESTYLPNPVTTVDDLVAAVRMRWRTVVLTIVTGGLVALLVGLLWPTQYSATAELTVDPVTVTPSATQTVQVNMQTEQAVASSTSVLNAAAGSVPGMTARMLGDALSVTIPKDAQVLDFTVTLPNGNSAAAAANAVAAAYRAQRVGTARAVVAAATRNVTARIQTLRAASQGGSSGTVRVQLSALQQSLATLDSITFSSGTLVTRAVPPQDSNTPSIAVFLAVGIVLGLLVGVLIAVSRRRPTPVVPVFEPEPSVPAVVEDPVDELPPPKSALVQPRTRATPKGTPAKSPARKPVAKPRATALTEKSPVPDRAAAE